MRFHLSAIAVSALLASVAFGQTERVLHFTYAESPQDIQTVNNVIRTIADIRDISADVTARTLTLRATAGQVAAGEWLYKELDQPSGAKPGPPNSSMHEYHLPGSTDVVRVYYMAHIDTPQATQEIVNATRSITDLQRMFPCFGPRAIAFRGTADQMALAEWVLNELDKPAPPPAEKPVVHEYRPPGSGDVVARVFFSGPHADAAGHSGNRQPDPHDGRCSAVLPARSDLIRGDARIGRPGRARRVAVQRVG